ncbi:FKBP-type peptidyl-prolyl cis-trans isomerase [Flavobacterium sp. RHBU_3]|uniref:FKBP-type peptidyl-prolyl cis-trans isomerase n=1 Tax=Flavobacterium sp. RHBU_3 TaxID=3391184 RepID=UPI00398529CC
MKRFLLAIALVTVIGFTASCHKDDNNVTPPRDYTEQYASEKDSIEKYLKNHYIKSVDAEFNIVLDSIDNPASQVSIWDQQQYPLQYVDFTPSALAGNSESKNIVTYRIYYLSLNEGAGDKPTRADDVLVSYRGHLLDDTMFDYDPFPQAPLNLYEDVYVAGWREILPLFGAGTYVDEPGSIDPAHFENYGAGVMFIPSGLAYYNSSSGLVGSYDSLIFSFKLYAVGYTDADSDGIENRYEYGMSPGTDIGYVDTDGDGYPDYIDADDDGDGSSTKSELYISNGNSYTFDNVPSCDGNTTDPNRRRIYLDAACRQAP